MTGRRFLATGISLVVLACSGEVVDSDADIVEIVVFPRQVDLVPDQTQLFFAYGHTSTGDSVAAAVNWSASSGSIDSDGRYTSPASPGEYLVTATHTQRNWLVDTALVAVEPEGTPRIALVVVNPGSVTLRPGGTQQFEVVARDQYGDTTAGTFIWLASGGSITPAGAYMAGTEDGAYEVVVTEISGLADTAEVTITGVDPVVTTVEVTPGSVALRPGGTLQFGVAARDQFGGVMPGVFSWSASGGSVTSAGFYEAGSQEGSYEVVATEASGVADTAVVTVVEQRAGFPNEPAGLEVLGEHSFGAGYFGDDEHFGAAAAIRRRMLFGICVIWIWSCT
ncbi:MAG: hypothetical protein AMS18_12370 [Gemmatimonas sp. SG8_17]|nr:MAG: hypothetical protein AMS18_12370 [Gemmatimonas sp. SG8_17]